MTKEKQVLHWTKHPLYWTWDGMKKRCYNKKDKSYKYYGAIGITMCSKWKESFDSFVVDMGPRPSKGHSIDRIDNSKGYSKTNCRWATAAQQTKNRRRNIECLNGHKWTKDQTVFTWAYDKNGKKQKTRRCKICLKKYNSSRYIMKKSVNK